MEGLIGRFLRFLWAEVYKVGRKWEIGFLSLWLIEGFGLDPTLTLIIVGVGAFVIFTLILILVPNLYKFPNFTL